jgi:hypothetical protein
MGGPRAPPNPPDPPDPAVAVLSFVPYSDTACMDDPSSNLGDEPVFQAQADLDVPGETGRQARIFAVWFVCLALAVIVGSAVGAHVALEDEGTLREGRELARSRGAKARVALVLGLALPALLTLALNSRYRRGGAHARGIVVDFTADGELRVWGRGYGTRVALAGAEVEERLVDVYAGRLGAWRQRRLRVRSSGRGGGREIELSTPARASDMSEGLQVSGGEGDCIELEREAFDALRALVFERLTSAARAPRLAPARPTEQSEPNG